ARDWARASYVQYAGLGWPLTAVGDHQQQDYAEETDKAIADTVETTIPGSDDECIRQLQQFDEIGIKHIAFRLILDGEPRRALESQLRRLSDLVLPRLRDKVRAWGSAWSWPNVMRRGWRGSRRRTGCWAW